MINQNLGIENNQKLSKSMIIMLILIPILNILDVITTNICLSLGGMEVNPIMNLFVGTSYFPIIKVVIPVLASIRLYQLANKELLTDKKPIVSIGVKLIVFMYTFVVIINTTSILILLV